MGTTGAATGGILFASGVILLVSGAGWIEGNSGGIGGVGGMGAAGAIGATTEAGEIAF